MSESLPTREEINVYNSLDEQSAEKHFLGKDLKQAKALFFDNFIYFQEDLLWMGPKAFCYYVDAAIAYLLSPDADEDSDAVSCFCGLIEFRMEHDLAEIQPALKKIHIAIEAILADFARYDDGLAIYDDLASRYRNLLQRIIELNK